MLTAVAQKVDNVFQRINQYPLDSAIIILVLLILLHWIVIYPVDISAIHCLSNQGLLLVLWIESCFSSCSDKVSFLHYFYYNELMQVIK